jgi:hypothetical protein
MGGVLLALVGANILAVNIAYDVGVAHFAGLMLAGCVYILAAELPRITAFFFGAGVTPPPERADPYFLSGSGRAVSNFTAIFVLLLPVADKVRDMPRGAVVSMPLTGAWEIVSASLSPPNPTNAAIRQWSRISFEKNFGGNQVAVWVADSMAHGRFQADTVAQQLRMTVAGYAVEPAFSGQWRLQADSIAHLRGTSGTDSVYLVLRRIR